MKSINGADSSVTMVDLMDTVERSVLFYQPEGNTGSKGLGYKPKHHKHDTHTRKKVRRSKNIRKICRLIVTALIFSTAILGAMLITDIAKIVGYNIRLQNTPMDAVQAIISDNQDNVVNYIEENLERTAIKELNIVEMDFDRIIGEMGIELADKVSYNLNDIVYTEYSDLRLLPNKLPIRGYVKVDIHGVDMGGYGDKFLDRMKNDLYNTLKENIAVEVNGGEVPDNYNTYIEWFKQPLKEINTRVDSSVEVVLELNRNGEWVVKNSADIVRCMSLALVLNTQSEMKYIVDNTSTLDSLKSYLHAGQMEELLNYSMNLMLNTEDADYSKHIDETMVADVLSDEAE